VINNKQCRYTEDANDFSGATTIIGNGKNMSDTSGELLKIFDDAVEGGSTGEDK
jgi:hypothetical protein